jgi:hypothetical protein
MLAGSLQDVETALRTDEPLAAIIDALDRTVKRVERAMPLQHPADDLRRFSRSATNSPNRSAAPKGSRTLRQARTDCFRAAAMFK